MKKMLIRSLFFLLLMGGSAGCEYNRPDYRALGERMADLEADLSDDPAENDERINQLKSDIKRVDREIDETIEKVRDRGTYYKLLGLKYMDYAMWHQGAEAFDGALKVYPENARLHYYRAVCLAQAGVNESSPAVRNDFLDRAEFDYLRAVELDRIYTSPLWGLAVLYVYELNRPDQGAVMLDRLLDIEPSNDKATLLRAELYRAQGNKMRALDLYRKLEVDGRDEEVKAEAAQRAATLGG